MSRNNNHGSISMIRVSHENTVTYMKLKACLDVPCPSPCLCPSPSVLIIVSMETDRLMDRMGSVPIKQNGFCTHKTEWVLYPFCPSNGPSP